MSFFIKDVDRGEYSDFYKNDPKSRVFWIDHIDVIGEFLFSFDRKKVYNLFSDYPQALSPDEKDLFDHDQPYWANFFLPKKSV